MTASAFTTFPPTAWLQGCWSTLLPIASSFEPLTVFVGSPLFMPDKSPMLTPKLAFSSFFVALFVSLNLRKFDSSQFLSVNVYELNAPEAPSHVVVQSSFVRTNHLPPWMQDYIAWHAEKMRSITAENWQQERYLVMRCLQIDHKCGGASDRIRGVPFALRLAQMSERILLIKWERPCALEEFLVPPVGGLDWRVKDFMEFPFTGSIDILSTSNWKRIYAKKMMVDMRHQSHDHGAFFYNEQVGNESASFDDIYHDVWSVLFEPSKPVQALIDSNMKDLDLETNAYSSVHIRAMYTKNKAGNTGLVENALHCGHSMQPGAPIYIASDSYNVTNYAIEYGSKIGVRVVTRKADSEPLHIDRGSDFLTTNNQDWHQHPPSDFYDTFVDLYLLAGGRCTTFNVGGYGRWANAISSDHRCSMDHQKHQCQRPSVAGANVTATAR